MPLTEQFWENERRRLLAIFLPRMTQMALTGMVTAARQAGIAFDNTLYSKLAENWARTQTEKILRDFVSTDLIQPADVPAGGAKYGTFVQGTGEIVADWIKTPGATVGDLNEKLGWLYDPVRVNAIAVTETTRAFASGQEEAYKAEGITEWIWRTNKDEMVCKYCGDANNKVVKIGEPFGTDRKGKPVTKPPFHPRCRCWVSAKVSKDKPKDAQAAVLRETSDSSKPIKQLSQEEINRRIQSNFPKFMKEFEREIVQQEIETAGIFKDGKIVFMKDGDKSNVYFTEAEKNSMENATVTHNHPQGTTFSEEDVALFTTTKMAELRIVGKEYNYILKNREGEKLSTFEYNAYYETAIFNELKKLPLGQKRPADFRHKVWIEFSRLAGITYERIENAEDK